MDIYGNDVYNINQTLKEQNEILKKMLGVIKKPGDPFMNILKIMGLFTGILAILNIFDKILNWIIGG